MSTATVAKKVVMKSSMAKTASRNGQKAAKRAIAKLEFEGVSLTLELCRITPEQAETYLESNEHNRPITKKVVEKYTATMKKQGWMINGETIIFDSNGILLNGQHRLKACVASGESFVSLIVRGVDPAVYITVDNVKKRTGSDALSIEGETNTNNLASAAMLYWRYTTGPFLNRWPLAEASDIIQTVRDLTPEIQESVRIASNMKAIMPVSGLALCHLLFTRQDAAKAEKFFDGLKYGINLPSGSPIHAAREVFLKRRQKARIPTEENIAILFKAWNAYRAGRQYRPGKLRWRSSGPGAEAFPKLED